MGTNTQKSLDTTSGLTISPELRARAAIFGDPKNPLGLSADGLKKARETAIAMTRSHPTLEKQVEELAKQGMAAEAKGDFATGHQTLLQAYALINAADDSSFPQDSDTLSAQKGDQIDSLLAMLGGDFGDDEDEDNDD